MLITIEARRANKDVHAPPLLANIMQVLAQFPSTSATAL
jgi:hypothetical protein